VDLAAALPLLLPDAIAWAQAEAAEALRKGSPLDSRYFEIARGVGVLAPEKVRVQLVDALPLPEDPRLRTAALQAGLLGPEMVGLTLGYAIFIRHGFLDYRMISHECRHVHQYEEHGGIENFLPVYLAEVVRVGYAAASFEEDARRHEVAPA
jgi:hypothetical protein